MRAVYRHTGPRDIHHCWIGEGDDPYCLSFTKGFPAFSGRLIVRSQRTRNIRREAAEANGASTWGARSTRVLKNASSPSVSGSTLPLRIKAALDSFSMICRDWNFTG